MICEEMFLLKKNGEPRKYRCYCRNPELIENYDKAMADTTQTWQVHHRKEEFYSYAELIARDEYFDVPPEDLIFLTESEHHNIDSACKRRGESHKGIKHSEEAKRKIGKAKSKKVLCVETGEIFPSTREAERQTGINHKSISMVCKGRYKTTGGYHWEYLPLE